MSQRQSMFVRNGFVVTCAVAAAVVFLVFYSTVTGAVERAARHRTESAALTPSPLLMGVATSGRSLVATTASAR